MPDKAAFLAPAGSTFTIDAPAAFPADPINGDTLRYRPDPGGNPNVVWEFGRLGGVWRFVGGAPIIVRTNAIAVPGVGISGDLVSFNVPRAGDFAVSYTAEMNCNVNTHTNIIALYVNGVFIESMGHAGAADWGVVATRDGRVVSVGAGAAISIRGRADADTSDIGPVSMSIIPVYLN